MDELTKVKGTNNVPMNNTYWKPGTESNPPFMVERPPVKADLAPVDVVPSLVPLNTITRPHT